MWQEPKTDWEIKPYINGLYNGDWFNAEDYNRIAVNLRYLRIVGQTLYGVIISLVEMPAVTVNTYPRASMFQAVEDNLYAIISRTYTPAAYTGKRTWADNGATPTVGDLNRIERSCAQLLAKFDETPLAALVTSGGDDFITVDGNNFMVREAA